MSGVSKCLALALIAIACPARADDKPAKPAAPAIRVGLVNYGVIFTKYVKATELKKELEASLAPLKKEAEDLKSKIEVAVNVLKNGNPPEEVAATLRDQIKQGQRDLEALDERARKDIGKRQETQLVALYREITETIAQYAKAREFDVVLAYGDPPDTDLMTPQNINRKMMGMDGGGSVPVYIRNGADITNDVLVIMNAEYQAKKAANRLR